jgi:hypothetical protein
MADERVTTTGPTLEQGCLMSAGAVVLTLGGCLTAAALESDLLFSVSGVGFILAGLVGLVLSIARFDRWLKRE